MPGARSGRRYATAPPAGARPHLYRHRGEQKQRKKQKRAERGKIRQYKVKGARAGVKAYSHQEVPKVNSRIAQERDKDKKREAAVREADDHW